MQRRSTSSAADRAAAALLWGCELTQEKRTCTFRPQEGKQGCKLVLSTICLGEKAKEEMNLVEILPPANQEDKKSKPITIASLQTSVLPMVVMMGFEISPPVTFQLRAGSGPVFLSGQECYYTSDLSWEEEQEEEEEEEEQEEQEGEQEEEEQEQEQEREQEGEQEQELEQEEEQEEEEEEEEGEQEQEREREQEEEEDVRLEEESPVKHVKRPAPQKQARIAKKKRVEKEEEAARPSLRDKSLGRKAKPTSRPKKLESKK